MATETQLRLVIDLLENILANDKVILAVDEQRHSIALTVKELDAEWIQALAKSDSDAD